MLSVPGYSLLQDYSQNLTSQKGAFNTNIIGITGNFFSFNGSDSVNIAKGHVAVNRRLADYLGVATGDEIVIRYKAISEIPADAPFAPSDENSKSIVMKVSRIIDVGNSGDFSLAISQIMPMNIFINLSDLYEGTSKGKLINRLLVDDRSDISSDAIFSDLRKILKPQDIGLTLRSDGKSGGYEIISDRIFLDNELIDEIRKAIPSSAPVITYLGNSFRSGNKSTPYSFISALPSSIYPEIGRDNEIIINSWMAEDLSASVGDTLKMTWYAPDSLSHLLEKSTKFIIKRIVPITGIWADSLLMPQFPGISGSESCSDWDAGVPIKTNEIRTEG